MIGRADRTVLPVKPLESPVVPLFGRGRRPCGRWIGLLVIGGPVDEVVRIDSLTLADRLGGLSDQHAVHVRRISFGKVAGGQFVLGRDVFGYGKKPLFPFHLLSFFKVSQGNEQVVFGGNLKDGLSIVSV